MEIQETLLFDPCVSVGTLFTEKGEEMADTDFDDKENTNNYTKKHEFTLLLARKE